MFAARVCLHACMHGAARFQSPSPYPLPFRLVRQPERSGLVKARLRGIKEARAETFIVLDSHIEVQPGWLEPMLGNLAKNKKNMIMPQIDR